MLHFSPNKSQRTVEDPDLDARFVAVEVILQQLVNLANIPIIAAPSTLPAQVLQAIETGGGSGGGGGGSNVEPGTEDGQLLRWNESDQLWEPYSGSSDGDLLRWDSVNGWEALSASLVRPSILDQRAIGAGTTRYCSSVVSANAGTTGAPAIDTLHAVPLVNCTGGPLDRITFSITAGGAAGSKARVGIYASTSVDDPTPDALVVDSGEYDGTVIAVNDTVISVELDLWRQYWLAYLCGVAAPTIRCWSTGAGNGIAKGISNNLASPDARLSVAQAYGPLPSTFPGGSVGASGAPIPAIAVRYA